MTVTPAQTATPTTPGQSEIPGTTQTFDGDYVVVDGASMFAGNCFNAREVNVASRQYRDCGVERAALNITGHVLTEYDREHLFLGNDFNVRGGTINLAGGVYLGNRFVANTIIIEGDALFVGRNTFEGQVFVKDPNQIAGQIFRVDDMTTTHQSQVASRVRDLLRCTNTLLEPQVFGQLDTAGEFANPSMDGQVRIHNLIAAGGVNDEVGRCAQLLGEDDYAHFSAIATVDGPRNPAMTDGITHAELELFRDELTECSEQMRIASGQGPGAALAALLDCGQSKTVQGKPEASSP
ncbi:hypothetical protein [Streptomyces fodineus]|nr:hypothetical protein [Streptomyces fodineus]